MAVSRYLSLFLGRRDVLSEAEREVLGGIPAERRSFSDGETIIAGGAAPRTSVLLVAGMVLRTHPFGSGAQVISAIHVPGDFVDLHALMLGHLDHDVVAQGDVVVEFIDHAALVGVTETHPHLTRLLWLSTLIDAKIHRQWVVAKSVLQAHARLGHLMCELSTRLDIVGLVENDGFDLPISQKTMADVLGYSTVHMNRAVRDLRARELLIWRQGRVTLPDMTKLAGVSAFDPAYLELDHQPR